MRSSRRLVVLAALAAAALAAAGASAGPNIQPETQQCDGTFVSGGSTHRPNPAIQAVVQDTTGLRIGQATMGATSTNATLALWRFDTGVTVADGGCAANKHTYIYNYQDTNLSPAMLIGQCVYNTAAACGASTTLFSSPMIPVGLGACPGAAPAIGAASIFPAGPFGGSDHAAAFNGTTQFASMTFVNSTFFDRNNSYTLSAWIKTAAGGTQNIISEGNASVFWGMAISGAGLSLFDSRNIDGTIGDQTTVIKSKAGITLNDGGWHKVDAVRIDGSQERLYADGTLLGFAPASSTSSFTAKPIGHPMMVGALEGAGVNTNFFNGQINEIRVTDAVLSDEDIRLEYVGSNIHQYSGAAATPYTVVPGGFVGVSNGNQGANIYTPSESPLTTNNVPNQRWIFEAQSTETFSTVLATFTVVIDASAPTVPQNVAGTPNGGTTNAITWSWTAPAHYCQSPGSPVLNYHMYDAVNGGAQLNPPGNIPYTQLSFSENTLPGPNLLSARRLTLSDVWSTSPLSQSASAYTMAADPVALTPTSISSGGFIATWGTSGNPPFTRYELTYTIDPTFATGVTTRVGIGNNFTGNSINVTGLAPGTTYYARVYAFNGQASDTYGGVRSTNFASLNGGNGVVTVPPGPTLTAVPVSNTVVQWNWTQTSGATGYTLYDTPTGAVMFGPNGDAVSFTSATLTPNTRYDAQVEAVLPSPSPVTARGRASTYTLANPPAAPIVVNAVYATSATYSWNPNGNPGYTFYQVIVATDPAFGVVTATLTVSAPTVTATGLLPGVTYYAEVQAINGSQVSSPPNAYVPMPLTVTVADPSITVNSSPPSPYVAPSGLVGAWQFDENTGTTTAEASGTGNMGNLGCASPACVSTPTWAAGPAGLGSALSFSGLAGGVMTTNSGAPFNFPDSVTIEAWVNPATSAQTAGAGVVAVGRKNAEDFAIDVSAAGAFEFLTSNAGTEIPITVATAAIAAGQWTHVVGVYDFAHSSATLYLNGVAAASRSAPPMPPRANLHPPLTVGNRPDAAGNLTLPFAGRIDSVRVIHAALTSAQVLADFQGGFVSSVTPTAPNNGITVALPPNAFGAPAQIFISADPVNHPIRIAPATLAAGLSVTPSGLTLVPNSIVEVVPVVGGLPFTTPLGSSATLTIPYKDPSGSGLISGTNPPLTAAGIQMYTLNTAVNAWVLLPTSVDKVNHAASGVTPHFSVFALFAPSTVASGLAAAKAFPVPWKPGSGGRFDAPGVTFSNLPASGTVRILTLAGRRVRDFSFNGVSAGSATWDGTNDDGRRAASGVYFARITSGVDGATTMLKFAIER